MAKIKDIYMGKPDAKDEIETDGLDAFFSNYIVPDNFNLKSLTEGCGHLITGYKGTGKTAVLYYIDNYLKERDPQTSSSFIFFKGDFSDLKKQEMESLTKRLTSSISIGNDVILEATDFEYIWRWLLYSRIVKDNQEYNGGLFIKDEHWDEFEKKLEKITPNKKRILNIPPKLVFSMPVTDAQSLSKIEPTMELDFKDSKVQESDSYRAFVRLIDELDELFEKIKRTDIPYYIFVDELEAYYGDKVVFFRDLRLIRDLIFTVKKMNLVFLRDKSATTKIICSVRTEIINSINRFVVPKEVNKVISGFEVPLIWEYSTTNSFKHPIMKILISRIKYGEEANGTTKSEDEIVRKWFPERINNTEPATYILNNTWLKPRDIVRLISTAQNCMAANNEAFSQNTIDTCRKQYSTDSLNELKEELRALYSTAEIDEIVSCFTGFKRSFSNTELRQRIVDYFSDSCLMYRQNEILTDLYRIGFIGNYMPRAKSYRWRYKGDDTIIISNEWDYVIHPALTSALSVNTKQDSTYKTTLRQGDLVQFYVKKIYPYLAVGEIVFNGDSYGASVHISQIANEYVKNIADYLIVNEKYNARVLEYDSDHKKWRVTIKGV